MKTSTGALRSSSRFQFRGLKFEVGVVEVVGPGDLQNGDGRLTSNRELQTTSNPEPVKIYTKTGDQGTTALFGGKRVSKAELRIDAYGTVDELNSFIGLVRDQEVNQKRKEVLTPIQNTLFIIGSILATEPGNKKVKIPLLSEDHILFLERQIDMMEAELQPLRFFILPGGHPSVSFCHVARTVCRRAERLTTALHDHEKVDLLVLKYLNRLSDYLFVLSRKMSQELGAEEMPWKPDV